MKNFHLVPELSVKPNNSFPNPIEKTSTFTPLFLLLLNSDLIHGQITKIVKIIKKGITEFKIISNIFIKTFHFFIISSAIFLAQRSISITSFILLILEIEALFKVFSIILGIDK